MSTLGNLEEIILLLVATNPGEAYGFKLSEKYRTHINKRISISAVHTVLKRMESKGFLTSKMGGASNERGGRRKRLFVISPHGLSVLHEVQESRTKLWGLMPLTTPKI